MDLAIGRENLYGPAFEQNKQAAIADTLGNIQWCLAKGLAFLQFNLHFRTNRYRGQN